MRQWQHSAVTGTMQSEAKITCSLLCCSAQTEVSVSLIYGMIVACCDGHMESYVLCHRSLGKPLAKHTVKELKDLLNAAELPVTGKKAELIDRLIEAGY